MDREEHWYLREDSRSVARPALTGVIVTLLLGLILALVCWLAGAGF